MKLKITVHGVAYDVDVEVLDAGEGFPSSPLPRLGQNGQAGPPSSGAHNGLSGSPPMAAHNGPTGAPSVAAQNGPSGNSPVPAPGPTSEAGSREKSVTSPIAGTVTEIRCKSGDTVAQAQELILMEAMKMEASIAAPAAGKVRSVEVSVGDAIREGQVVVHFD